MARQRNPRVVAYDLIKQIRTLTGLMASDWSGPRKVVVRDPDGRNAQWITAPPEDQPENLISYWSALALDAHQVAESATSLREYADTQIRRLRSERGGGGS